MIKIPRGVKKVIFSDIYDYLFIVVYDLKSEGTINKWRG